MPRKSGKNSKNRSGSNGNSAPPAALLLFDSVAESLCRNDMRVERVKLFGFDCLRASGKVFAKIHKGRLVMKLPATRIASLMAAGAMEPYERSRGEMKEWAVVISADRELLVSLSQEAYSFVIN